jgi:hypothetical protein
MGRTIPSFRIAADIEKAEWKPFRHHLNKKDKRLFDEMFSISKMYNSPCSYHNYPIIIRPVMMSIIFYNYKQLLKLKGELKDKDTNIKPIPEKPRIEFNTEKQDEYRNRKDKTLQDYF